jgi:ABC-type Fe3+ transport system permease subunit
LRGETRVLTGEILRQQSQGEFGAALAFGLILLGLMVSVNALFTWIQAGARRDREVEQEPREDPLTLPASWIRT